MSIVEIPVWIISSGYILEYGLIGDPYCIISTHSHKWRKDDECTIDIKIILRKDLRSLIDWVAAAVEYPSEHVFSDGQLHAAASELDMRRLHVHTRCALEDLHNRLLSLHF